MQGKRLSTGLKAGLAIFIVALFVTSTCAAQQETVLHSFGNGTDGEIPYAGLTFDAAGNLYGTTYEGGIHSLGTVFELSPRGGGGYTETVLHSFGNGTDGQYPYAGLIFDGAGNLYGTTYGGGIHDYGTVFELSPRESRKVFHRVDIGTYSALRVVATLEFLQHLLPKMGHSKPPVTQLLHSQQCQGTTYAAASVAPAT